MVNPLPLRDGPTGNQRSRIMLRRASLSKLAGVVAISCSTRVLTFQENERFPPASTRVSTGYSAASATGGQGGMGGFMGGMTTTGGAGGGVTTGFGGFGPTTITTGAGGIAGGGPMGVGG